MNINIYIEEEELKKRIINQIIEKKIPINKYITELIKKDLYSIIYLENNFSFDTVAKKLYKDKKEISLRPMEYKILNLLIENKNRIVKFEDFKLIWNEEMISSRLRIHIKKLRNLSYKELIKNHPKIGYELIVNE